MTRLLDTDVVINHIRKIKLIELAQTALPGISIITYAELLYGVERAYNPAKIGKALDEVLRKLTIQIVNLNEQVIKRFARIKVTLEKSGARLEDFDLMIAATALEYDLTLITANKRHFSRIPGLKLA